jgi:citrate synthase
MTEKATLTFRDKTLELPVLQGTEDEFAVDIGKLRQSLGLITYDPGYMNTGACQSDITFIDGEKGILQYRGYPIEELAERSSFLEVSYLLIHGELPTPQQLESFKQREIGLHTMVHEDVKRFIEAFPKDAHPMAICGSVVGALGTFYPRALDPKNAEQVERSTNRLLAKLPTIAAYAFKHSIGQPFMYPRNDLDYSSNFMHMMFATPAVEYHPDPVIAKALDLLLILHADHEQNCSTSTVRMVGSSHVNLFASISAGMMALWGPLHGGANQAVIEMLEQIAASGDSGRQFLEKVKDRDGSARLMGFGHRVYKNFDPRAKIIKKSCFEVLNKLGIKNKLLEIAVELEEMALRDEYFVQRKLYPNVDFYSGIIYQAIGIPVNMFTVMFAIGRLPGWIAQWREMHQDPALKIGRPRQIYQGSRKRAYVPMNQRS